MGEPRWFPHVPLPARSDALSRSEDRLIRGSNAALSGFACRYLRIVVEVELPGVRTQSNLLPARKLYVNEGYRLVQTEEHAMFGVPLTAETWELAL